MKPDAAPLHPGANPPVRAAAETVLAYLAEVDPEPAAPVDAVIGFGVFDLRLPRFCAELFGRGLARRIIFTGGFGAGTGSLGKPEADAWRDEVRRSHPDIPDQAIRLENRSTNTAENIQLTAHLLATTQPEHAFGTGIRSAIIVASPSRLRRVRLTMQQLQPGVHVSRRLPPTSLDAEASLYGSQGIDYIAHLLGELDRIATYPLRGWIAPEPLPSPIVAAGELLRASGQPPHGAMVGNT